MKYIIHLITDDYNLITTIYSAFKNYFPQHDFDIRKYTNKNEINKQLFEEEVEHKAFTNLKEVLEMDKSVMEDKKDIVLGIGEGIKKDNYEDDEGVYFYGIIHLLFYYNNFMYSNESEKIYIKQELNHLVNESQSDVNRINLGKLIKENVDEKEFKLELDLENNWYIIMDPRKNKYILIEKMLTELFDNIKLEE